MVSQSSVLFQDNISNPTLIKVNSILFVQINPEFFPLASPRHIFLFVAFLGCCSPSRLNGKLCVLAHDLFIVPPG